MPSLGMIFPTDKEARDLEITGIVLFSVIVISRLWLYIHKLQFIKINLFKHTASQS